MSRPWWDDVCPLDMHAEFVELLRVHGVDEVARNLELDVDALRRFLEASASAPLPDDVVLMHDATDSLAGRRGILAYAETQGGGRLLFGSQRLIDLWELPSREQRNCGYLIHLLYRDQRKADAVLGDLDELLGERAKRYGKRRALRWYRAQVAWSLIDLLWPLLKSIVGIAAIRELWHRIVSR